MRYSGSTVSAFISPYHIIRPLAVIFFFVYQNHGLKHGKVSDRNEAEEIVYELKYKLAAALCESYHTAKEGIALHQELIDLQERYWCGFV